MPVSTPPSKPGKVEVVDVDFDRAEIKWEHSSDPDSETDSYEIQKRVKGDDWEAVSEH